MNVHIDGYEASNLLNNDTGFLAASFVKPPVTLRIEFPCPVNIAQIKIVPAVLSSSMSCTCLLFALSDSDSGGDKFHFVGDMATFKHQDQSVLLNPIYYPREFKVI